MPKIVIFDSGFGGELFADRVEDEFPKLEIIRVIDWRHANQYLKNNHSARKAAEQALKPYINQVDVIVFANHLLSTNLKYFCRRYKTQKFSGFEFQKPERCRAKSNPQNALVLTTKSASSTFDYFLFKIKSKLNIKTVQCDQWVNKIDDDILTEQEIIKYLQSETQNFKPQMVILGCTQLADIKPTLKKFFGPLVAIEDGYHRALKSLCKTLACRGFSIKTK